MANPVLKTTIVPMSGGVAANTGTGQIVQIAVQNSPGNWAAGDKYTFLFTETLQGFQVQYGAGDVTALVPTFLLTYKKKLNFLAGTNWYFSAIDLPTTFNDINTAGNGFIELANNFATSEALLALLPFQGRIAVNGRSNLQLWTIAADPGDYALAQTLQNVSTLAGQSVLGIGEMDGLFLSDSGIRAMRVLATTLNAESIDVGSPIDLIIQDLLLSCSAAEKSAACGVREPATGLYWLFIKNTCYVFAYYPSVKILAWSQWDMSYQTGDVSRITNNSAFPLTVKLSQVNDATKADQTYTIASSASQDGIKPFVYIFVYNAGGDLILSSSTTLGFRGHIDLTLLAITFTSNQTTFVPQKFIVHNGQVFARTSSTVFTYGGAANGTYDNNIAVAEISWLPLDEPGTRKTIFGIDLDIVGTWNMFGSTDYISGLFQRILDSITFPTYEGGNISWRSTGTHVKTRIQTAGVAEKCTISGQIIYTLDNQSKGANASK